MLEVVFSDSACGSLKRDFPRSGDVYGFSLALSVGEIAADAPNEARRRALCALCHFPLSLPGILEQIDRFIENAALSLKAVLDRSAGGEAVRLWYSDQPDEMCGFYWITAQLDSLDGRCGPIRLVKLPPYVQGEDGSLTARNGWGEVVPGEWGRFLPLETSMSLALRRSVAAQWHSLQEENSPLRAVLNGRLVSVPEDFYDSLIRRELAKAPAEFQQAVFLEDILCRYPLGIRDGLVASRMEAMITKGELEIVKPAPDDAPSYARVLRKTSAVKQTVF